MHPGGTSGAGLNPPSVARIKQLCQLDLLHSLLLLHFMAGGGGGGRFPRSAPSAVCTHILGRLPSRQIALGAEPQFLRRPPPTFLQTEAPRANRRGTRRTRRIIFVEGRDRDRSSHNSPPPSTPTPPFHCSISISLPSGMPTKVSLSQIIISRMQQSAHLDALTGGEPRQKGFISCDKKISR